MAEAVYSRLLARSLRDLARRCSPRAGLPPCPCASARSCAPRVLQPSHYLLYCSTSSDRFVRTYVRTLVLAFSLSLTLSRSFSRSLTLSLCLFLFLSLSLALSLRLFLSLSLVRSFSRFVYFSFFLSRSFSSFVSFSLLLARSLAPSLSLSRSFSRFVSFFFSLSFILFLARSLVSSLSLSFSLSRSFSLALEPSLVEATTWRPFGTVRWGRARGRHLLRAALYARRNFTTAGAFIAIRGILVDRCGIPEGCGWNFSAPWQR